MKINTSHFELLGLKAEDKITGFKGIITSLSYDLFGCIQVVITPSVDDSSKLGDGHWFDVTRLIILDDMPAMNLPDFTKGYVADGKKGAADKPIPNQ